MDYFQGEVFDYILSDGYSESELLSIAWTDYSYAVVLVCEEVQDDDYCAEGKKYVDVISRDAEPIPASVYEKIQEIVQEAGLSSGVAAHMYFQYINPCSSMYGMFTVND